MKQLPIWFSRLTALTLIVVSLLLFYTNVTHRTVVQELTTERDFYKAQSFQALGIATAAVDLSEKWSLLTKAYAKEVFLLRAEARIIKVNPKAPAKCMASAIMKAADFHDLDRVWFLAQVEQESAYNPKAVGLSGERGLMQIARTTAPGLSLAWNEAFDIEKNLNAGASYMAQHIKTHGNLRAAQLRYNGGNPEYPELIRARHAKILR